MLYLKKRMARVSFNDFQVGVIKVKALTIVNKAEWLGRP